MKKIITAIGNPILNEYLKKEEDIIVIGNDIQYQDGIFELLEKDNNINLIIISEIIIGENTIEKLIEKIKIINKNIKIIIILENKNEELENKLIEYNRMKDENIDFHYHLDIPQQLSISDIDLTSILSNGLENAFKAVMPLENERFIELNMQEKCGKLLISIENNYLPEPIFIDGIPISKEKDHGFGTQSIAYTVEKLHGNCQFSTHQHHFKLRVVI